MQKTTDPERAPPVMLGIKGTDADDVQEKAKCIVRMSSVEGPIRVRMDSRTGRQAHVYPPNATSERAKGFLLDWTNMVSLKWPVKRNSALRGRNRARNGRTDGAPKRSSPRGGPYARGPHYLLVDLGYWSHTPENPGGWGGAQDRRVSPVEDG